MESLERVATAKTPYISFDPYEGLMLIKGRSIPASDEDFWSPILKWVYAYSTNPNKETKLIMDIEYFNNTSAKQILFLLHKLNELFERGLKVNVEWIYGKDDIEMKEAGFDFSCMVNFPFNFSQIVRELVVKH